MHIDSHCVVSYTTGGLRVDMTGTEAECRRHYRQRVINFNRAGGIGVPGYPDAVCRNTYKALERHRERCSN